MLLLHLPAAAVVVVMVVSNGVDGFLGETASFFHFLRISCSRTMSVILFDFLDDSMEEEKKEGSSSSSSLLFPLKMREEEFIKSE